ncbi:unnamed protein product, partial [Protopolystoma xenopodis]
DFQSVLSRLFPASQVSGASATGYANTYPIRICRMSELYDLVTQLKPVREKPHHIRSLFLLFTWHPNSLTVRNSLVAVSLPDCLSAGSSTEANSQTSLCDFQLHQLTKLAWSRLDVAVPLISQLISRIRLTHQDYIDLLSQHLFLL